MIGQRTLRVLEFNRILDMAAEGAQTPLGAEKCRDLKPYDNIADVIAAQAETEEAAVILQYIGASPMSSFPDVRPSLVICEKGASLSPAALLNIAALLKASSGMKSALVTERENTPVLRAKAEGLFEMRSLERDITDAIISEDEIADRASPALADIRRHLRGAREKIRERLNQMIRSSEMQKMLQEPVVTVRNDRYVIPVRAEYVNQVPGLVHDRSASGATLFVEPLAAVEAGNELKQWELKEREEIARILAELSAKVAPYAAELRENTEILTDLDFIFAKGQLSRRLYCVQPKLNDRGYIRIVRGRHPLIDPEKVVPLDLWLGTDFNTLVVTGPNTGGKTVTLKTTGLFTLMAQAGLQVPADPGTELAVFEQIFADIGDEQSIEQSLSTFSGHMTNIVTIMREVTPRDLVLFDELGAGTDPTEGAALAQSILTRLLHIRVRTIATTHYSELKVFAMTTQGVENASVEFNVETLRPTYRLSIGVPGKSNAFEISRRLGLPENLIDAAKNLLSGENIRFEDVIADAEYHRQVAEKERMLAQEASKETVRLRDEAEKLRKEMEERREQTLRKTREDARRILEQARRESEGILSDLKRLRKNAAAGNEGEAAALKKRLEHDIDEVSEGLKQAEDDSVAPDSVKAGDTVMILTLNAEGVVLAPADPKGDVQVQIGSMKMKAPLSALRIRKQEKPNAKTVVRAKTGTLTRTVSQECDVRGMMLDEAQTVVGLYLDEAVLAGLNEVSIIHGKGTGVLRAGIRQDLKKNKHVKSWRPGMYGEGEDGVTVVSLK